MSDRNNDKVLQNFIMRSKKIQCSQCNTLLTQNDYLGYEAYKCPECGHEEISNFGKVRRYLEKHPGASLHSVTLETGVPMSDIRTYLARSRVEITEDSPVFLSCEKCGASIKSGRICDRCAASGKFSSYLIEEVGDSPKNTGKMRYLSDGKSDLPTSKRMNKDNSNPFKKQT